MYVIMMFVRRIIIIWYDLAFWFAFSFTFWGQGRGGHGKNSGAPPPSSIIVPTDFRDYTLNARIAPDILHGPRGYDIPKK